MSERELDLSNSSRLGCPGLICDNLRQRILATTSMLLLRTSP